MATRTIRTAKAGDANSVAEIHVQAWRETYAGLLPKDLLDGLSVERRTAVFIVVDEHDQAVGFGSCGRQRDPELDAAGFDAEVETIYWTDIETLQSLARRDA